MNIDNIIKKRQIQYCICRINSEIFFCLFSKYRELVLIRFHQLPQKAKTPPKLPHGTLKCLLNDAAVRL